MFNIVLVEPEIPANTGNIGRTCVVAGARLHLVRPLGFSLDAKTRRRAGLLYWDHVDLRIHDSWGAFLEREFGSGDNFTSRLHLATKKALRTYAQAEYRDGDYLVFGKESTGLPEEMLVKYSQCCERIPMLDDKACGFRVGGEGAITNNNGETHDKACGFRGGGERARVSDDGDRSADAKVGEGAGAQPSQDICGNFVDVSAYSVNALNLSNSVAIMLYEALRQTGFQGMES